jgi:L-threonylcarbamoyladenylate synthase
LNTELNTEIISALDVTAVERAVKLLSWGELVAVPTETVYGLAADSRNDRAVAAIFQVKERPYFNPLILHLPDRTWVERLAKVNAEQGKLVAALIERFWPGPLTLLLAKREEVSDLAAPSANRFGRVSPTTAQHVMEELAGRIPLIVDDGPTKLGLESTIVEPRDGKLVLHRPGPITEFALGEFGVVELVDLKGAIHAPGQTPSHYAPNKPVRLVKKGEVPADSAGAGLLAWGPSLQRSRFRVTFSLSESGDLLEAASRLFSLLRAMDREPVTAIYVEKVPEIGIGKAIMNRLYRAEGASVNEREPA